MKSCLVEVGYKLVKVCGRAVSCSLNALGQRSEVNFVSGSASFKSKFSLSHSLVFASLVGAVPAASLAQEATPVIIDGQNAGGFLIDSTLGNTGSVLAIGDATGSITLDRYEGGSVNIGTTDGAATVFTGFETYGGNGSGGGAGLGGVFFVDQGAALTLSNVVFAGNSVKGGEGGSDPAVRLGNKSLSLQSKSLDLIEISQGLASPQFTRSNEGVYSFQIIDLSKTGTDLVTTGSSVVFDSLPAGSQSGEILGVTSTTVTLESLITLAASDVTSLASDVYQFTTNGIDLTTASDSQIASLEGAISIGSTVFVGAGFSSKVTELVYDNLTGVLAEVKLEDDAAAASGSLDIISLNSFKLQQFSVQGSSVEISGAQRGFEVGMDLFDSSGNALDTKITSVSEDGASFTVTNSGVLSGVTSFEARKSPVISSTEIEVSAASSGDFYVGATVYFGDTDETRTVTSVNTSQSGVTTLSLNAAVDTATLETRVADGVAIAIELQNVKSASGQTLVVYGDGLAPGMVLQGDGLEEGTTIASVSAADGQGFVTVMLENGRVEAGKTVTSIVAKSGLSKGGAMNSLQAAGPGDDGANGLNKNSVSSFFNGGEGEEGTNGYGGGDGDGGAGGDGGYGGNGSDGMPVNPNALRNLKSATNSFATATSELIDAISPPIVVGAAVGVPKPSAIVTKSIKFAGKAFDFATAIYENVTWGINLSNGIAGMGGAGGEGGEAGGGDEFFGGGSGGVGGNGGEGALSFTDGGDGGNGGRGGDGGFGAGGGMGGAGGDEGSTGAANGGDPGEGGFGGFAAGDGSNGNALYGDGGSGFGGAIFVRETGTLMITGNAHFQNNVARGGSSNNLGSAGDGAGAAIFMMKGSTVTLAPGAGNVIVFDDEISDDSAATYEGAPFAEGAGSDIIIHGDGGRVVFNVENTYSGDTILRGATLDAVLGEGVNDASRLRFDGGGSIGNQLSLGTTGTLLLNEDLTGRRVGNSNSQVKWSGSGGFAAGDADGFNVILGEVLPGVGQDLEWGANGFFEGATTSALTFGSDESLGHIVFANNVNVLGAAGIDSAQVAVYNTGTQTSADVAFLTGNWSGAGLAVGDASSDYTGLLYVTGQNTLEQFQVLGGTVSTFNIQDPTASGTLLRAGGDLNVGEGSTLQLYGAEGTGTVTVAAADTASSGELNIYNTVSATDVGNLGMLVIDSGTDILGTTDGGDGMLQTAGSLNASGTLTNASVLIQNGSITAGTEVVNDGYWSVVSSHELKITNTATGVVNAGLTGTGTFCLETAGGNGATCAGDAEDPVAIATTLTIDQAGDSLFAGVFAGLGNLTKAGAGDLILSGTNTFTGAARIEGGSLSFQNGAAIVDTVAVTLSDAAGLGLDIVDSETIAMLAGGASDSDVSLSSGATLTTGGAIDTAYVGGLSGAGSLVKQGAGDFTVNGTSTFTGGLNVNAGGLIMGATTDNQVATLADTLAINVASDASFTANSADTVGAVTTVGTVAINADYTMASLANNAGSETVIAAGSTLTVGTVGATDNVNVVDASLSSVGTTPTSIGSLATNKVSFSGTTNLSARLLTDDVLVSSGTLTLIGSDLFGVVDERPNLEVMGPATVELFDGSHTIGKLNGLGLIKLNGHSLTVEGMSGQWSGSLDTGTAAEGAPAPSLAFTGSQTLDQFSGAASPLYIGSSGTVSVAVGGNVEVGDIAVDGMFELKSGTNNSEMSVVKASTINVNSGGMLKGIGKLTTDVVIHAGGRHSPGASPGVQVITGNYQTAGTLNIELDGTDQVVAGGLIASTDFDTITVSGSVTIDSATSALVLSNSGSGVRFEPDKAESFHFLQMTDPSLSTGYFGSVTSDFGSVTSDLQKGVLVSLTSGEVVGTGEIAGASLSDIVGQTDNESRIVSDLMVSDAGGVEQYRGGNFATRLLSATSTAEETALFEAASPESYASFVDFATRSASSLMHDHTGESAGIVKGGLSYVSSFSGRSSGESFSNDNAAYSMSGTGATLGIKTVEGERTQVSSFIGFDNGKINSRATRSNVEGLAFGAGLEYRAGNSENLLFSANMVQARHDFDGTRKSFGGTVSEFNTSSRTTGVGVGVNYEFAQSQDNRFVVGLNVLSLNGSIDSFTEENSEIYNGLTVGKQRFSDVKTTLTLGRNYRISDNGMLSGMLSMGNTSGSTDRDVMSNFAVDDQQFGVSAPGFDAQFSTLELGYQYEADNGVAMSVRGNFGLSGASKDNQKISANFSVRF